MKPSSTKVKDEKKSRVVISDRDHSSSESTPGERKKSAFDDLHARISCRAYELYLQRGCREGRAEEDWLEAEREILDREFQA
jgi:Protein of unknown function (DUF2934)